MRLPTFAAAAAALCLATPAAAQPSAPRILEDAIHRMAADLSEVEGYTFTLAHGAVRTPVYVHRTGTSWQVSMPPTRLSDVLGLAVFWPGMQDPAELEAVDQSAYVRQEPVDGRPAHVIAAALGADRDMEEVDSAYVFVDTESLRVVRILVAAAVPNEMGAQAFGAGARMIITVDAGGHRETDGLVLPARLRVRMLLDAPAMPEETRRRVLDQVAAVRAQLQGTTDHDELEMLALMDTYAALLSPAGMDVPLAVEDVRVNPGAPDWLVDIEG